MTTAEMDLDLKQYGKLLAKAVPKVIKSEAENERLLAVVESLMSKGEEALTAEEGELLELLTGLIHDFESAAYEARGSEPHESLRFLLDERDVAASSLTPIFGSRPAITAVLAGKREITRNQAAELGRLFGVRPMLFR